ncbi:MAG: hypothetical protein JWP34_4701 [Massilia sp.]|nr:hypothetical protein [Massilia sp.]
MRSNPVLAAVVFGIIIGAAIIGGAYLMRPAGGGETATPSSPVAVPAPIVVPSTPRFSQAYISAYRTGYQTGVASARRERDRLLLVTVCQTALNMAINTGRAGTVDEQQGWMAGCQDGSLGGKPMVFP